MSLDRFGPGSLEECGWIGFPGVIFRPRESTLEVGDCAQQLTPKANALLLQLCLAYPHAAARETLLDQLWGQGRGSPETIAQVVAELRRKLGDEARAPRYIRTVSKVGFQLLVEPVALNQAGSVPINTLADGPRRQEPEATPYRLLPMRRIWALLAITIGLAMTALLGWLWPSAERPSESMLRPTLIADDAVIETMPRAYGTAGAIVYAVQQQVGGDFDIAFREPGQARPRIITSPQGSEFSPVPSADRRQLAFVRQQQDRCQVMLSDGAGQLQREIAECEVAGPGRLIDMTAEGRWLDYTATTNPSFQSRVVTVLDLQAGRALYHSDAQSPLHTDFSPRLSADGSRLSFFRHDYQSGWIQLRLQQGASSRELLPPQGERWVAHAWSPQNRLYALSNDGSGGRLVELDPDSGSLVRVIGSVPDGRNLDYDGRRFVYSTARVEDTYVASVDFSGSPPARVTSARSAHRLPQLSASGKRLLFATGGSQGAEIWVVELSSGIVNRLASLGQGQLLALNWHPDESSLGALFSARDGSSWRVELAFPGGAELLRESCPGARAMSRLESGEHWLIRDQSGRHYTGCDQLNTAAKALASDALVIQRDGAGGMAASFGSQMGVWSLDPDLQASRALGDYRRGRDFSWAINRRWYARVQQDPEQPEALYLVRENTLDGEQQRIRLDQLDLTAGIDVDADGRVFVVLNELEDVDIVALDWDESRFQ